MKPSDVHYLDTYRVSVNLLKKKLRRCKVKYE